jgi:NAD(P)H-flavin reductase
VNPLKPIKVRLKEVKDENADVKTYTLQVNHHGVAEYRPGQFNMVGYPGIGEAPISFSSLGRDGEIEHTIRAVGMATRFMQRMKKGGHVLLRGPYGRGWPMEAMRGKDLLLIAGGIGLAPIRPIIRHVIEHRQDYGTVSVLIGSRNEKGLIFTDEYPSWRESMSLHITVDESTTGETGDYRVGLITSLLDSVKFTAEKTIALVCGPEIMMRFVSRGLLLKNMSPSDIHVSLERRMKCGIAQCGHCQHVGLFVCKDGPVFSYREVSGLYDGML